jgi:hypothetical protein
VLGRGPVLGLLETGVPADPQQRTDSYETITTERYDPAGTSCNNIYGRASWFTGLGEIRIYSGGFGRMRP